MTNAHTKRIQEKLRKLVTSIRAGKRTDDLAEAEVRAYWMYLEGHSIGSRALELNFVRTREELTQVITKVRAALREMRELEHFAGTGRR